MRSTMQTRPWAPSRFSYELGRREREQGKKSDPFGAIAFRVGVGLVGGVALGTWGGGYCETPLRGTVVGVLASTVVYFAFKQKTIGVAGLAGSILYYFWCTQNLLNDPTP